MGVLALASTAAALNFTALQSAGVNPAKAGLTCTSMSYGVSCRGTLRAYSSRPVSVQRANSTRYIIQVSKPTFTLNQLAPQRGPALREGYQKILSGPFKGHYVRDFGGGLLAIRSAAALNGLYD